MVPDEKRIEEETLEDTLGVMKDTLSKQNFCLEVKTNWPLVQKTYSEVGGRFIEDFFLRHGPTIVAEKYQQKVYFHNVVKAYAPPGRRTIEDIVFEWSNPKIIKDRQILLISVKGHQKDIPSYPNLASLQKTTSFYSNSANRNKHIIVTYCTFTVEPLPYNGSYNGFIMKFDKKDIDGFHLKNLSEKNIDFENIEEEHQIILCDSQNIKITYRTREKFIKLLTTKVNLWEKEFLKKQL